VNVVYEVQWTEQAVQSLEKVRDRRIQRLILKSGDSLSVEPEKKGKALVGALAGYRSLRVAGQRYRIVYRVERERITVWISAAGLRKEGDRRDVYELAKRLINLGLLK
jgi:mRNA interferase RelE/StbE